jgi:hypothetical protein
LVEVCAADDADDPIALTAADGRLLEFFDRCADKGLRLYQFLRYTIEVYGIGRILTRVSDTREDPVIQTFPVVTSLLLAAVLRVPSINQLEHLLKTGQFQRLLGERLKKRQGKPLFSADTIVDVLDSLEIVTLQTALAQIIKKAERTKAFRDDTFGTFICTAIDGWEPFCSYKRHCDACLTRMVKRKVKLAAARSGEDGIELDEEDLEGDPNERVPQYYHRFVVAFLIAPKLDLTLAIEPIRTEAQLVAAGAKPECGNEGELTAALRLLDRVHATYGCFIDAFALDGLYPCGPIFEKLTEHGYGATIITRDKRKDPYRFAESIWEMRDKPDLVMQDAETGDEVAFYRLNNVNALSSFNGSVDMLKAVVTTTPKPKRPNKSKNSRGRNINVGRKEAGPKTSTWVMALVGKAKRLNHMLALRIMRARWHIENTAFHQWVTQWNFDHCYRHTPNAINAVMHIFAMAFNLMQLFFYRRLNKPRKRRAANDTLVACVKSMWLDLGQLAEPVPWDLLLANTS